MLSNKFYVNGDTSVQVPAHINFGKYMLDRLRFKSDEVALENGVTGEKITYKEVTQYAVNLAVCLTKLGVGRGDTVAVGSETRIEFIPTVLGIVFTGAAYTTYEVKNGRAALKHNLSITKPKYFLCSKLFWNAFSDVLKSFDCIREYFTLDDGFESAIPIKRLVLENVDTDLFEPAQVQGQSDTALILYSSGTTGMPKGVQLTHLNCILNSLPNDFTDPSLKVAFMSGGWYHNYYYFMTYKFLSAGRKIIYGNSSLDLLKCVAECDVGIFFYFIEKTELR